MAYTHCFLPALESVLRAARARFAAEGDDCYGAATAAEAGVDPAMEVVVRQRVAGVPVTADFGRRLPGLAGAPREEVGRMPTAPGRPLQGEPTR